MPTVKLVKNANILTMDDAGTVAQSMLLRDGKVAALDPDMAAVAQADEVIDAQGRTVLPGFIDAHAHFEMLGYGWGIAVDHRSPGVASIDDLVERLRAKALVTAPGKWILGQGNHYQDQLIKDGRYPDRHDLDKASTEHPIVSRFSFHINVFNSKALEVLGVDHNTPDHAGGFLERDPKTGELTGRTSDMWHALGGPDWPMNELRPAFQLAQKSYLSSGVTGICEFTLFKGGIGALVDMAQSGDLKLRVSVYPKVPDVCSLESAGDGSLAARFKDVDPERLRLGGIKLFLDGGLTSKAAAMHSPYYGTDVRGDLAFKPEVFADIVAKLHGMGHQVAVHAIGDRALDVALDAFGRLNTKRTDDTGLHRIEHAGNAFWNDERRDRFRAYNMLPIPQPPFIYTTAAGYEKNLGPERGKNLFPFHTMVVKEGFPVPGNSDAIGIHPKQHVPMFGIWCLAARKMNNGKSLDTAEKLDVDTALKMYTRYAARSIGREHAIGSLEPGKWADFILFDSDPREAPIDALADMQVMETWIGGERVYQLAS